MTKGERLQKLVETYNYSSDNSSLLGAPYYDRNYGQWLSNITCKKTGRVTGRIWLGKNFDEASKALTYNEDD